jgi:hypothetical protein
MSKFRLNDSAVNYRGIIFTIIEMNDKESVLRDDAWGDTTLKVSIEDLEKYFKTPKEFFKHKK